MNDQTLSLRISKGEFDALHKRARAEGISRGSLVRRALRAYGIAPETQAPKTGYDVIKHLIGRNRGRSKDLSSNPAHLADYGR